MRAITKLCGMRDRSVVRSSVIPSAKYSWSRSFDRLVKGRTTIDRLGSDCCSAAGPGAATGASALMAIDPHRPGDVFELLLTEVYKGKLHLAGDVFINLAGYANAARLSNGLETSSDVDAIAVDAGVIKDNVALVDPDAEPHAAGFLYTSIALRHRSLDCHRTLGGAHDTAELCEDPIAGVSMMRPPCSVIMGSMTP